MFDGRADFIGIGGKRLDVAAHTKSLACTRSHHAAYVFIFGAAYRHVHHFFGAGQINAVALFGPIEGHGGHVLVDV